MCDEICSCNSEDEMRYTVEELTDLSEDEIIKLDNPCLPNNDSPTDEDAWEKLGVETAHEFIESSAGALNLLLGKK